MRRRINLPEHRLRLKAAMSDPAAAPNVHVADRAAGLANHSLLAFARLLARQAAAEAAEGNPAPRPTSDTGSNP
jgi:hypothetical protein